MIQFFWFCCLTSLIQYGKNECLKISVLDENVLRVSFCGDQLLQAGFVLLLYRYELRYTG